MAKKRKTRSQKIAADLRQQKLPSPSLTQSVSLTEIGIQPVPAATISRPSSPISQDYHFVSHDLRKTSLITGAIILVELVLFFVVKL